MFSFQGTNFIGAEKLFILGEKTPAISQSIYTPISLIQDKTLCFMPYTAIFYWMYQ